ncbi:MAG: lysylphosphatidylglycerol synthase transmembrane domain-containing protein [Armatimonadia bacterium]
MTNLPPDEATDGQPTRRVPVWARVLVILISLAIIALLVSQIHPRDIAQLLQRAKTEWLVPALGFCLLMQVLRGWRFHTLTRHRLPLLRLSGIAMVQNLLLTVLPMRAGEVSFVALLAREGGLGVALAGKILVAVRLMDLAVVTGLFIISSQLLPSLQTPLMVLLPALLLLALCVGLVVWPQTLARVLQPMSRWALGLPGLRRWRAKGEALVEHALTVADPDAFRSLLPSLWLQSVLIWSCGMAINYAALHAVGLGLSAAAVVYVSTVTVVSSVVPINGPAGYGAQDAVSAAVLLVLGIGRAEAIAAELGWHTLNLLLCIITGALGWLYLAAGRGKDERERRVPPSGS